MISDITELTAKITSAYVSTNTVSVAAIPDLIRSIRDALINVWGYDPLWPVVAGRAALVAAHQDLGIARECPGIAGDGDDGLHLAAGQLLRLRLRTGARREPIPPRKSATP